jgi:hypothetical protein
MIRRVAWSAAAVLVAVSAAFAGHGPDDLNAAQATPGVHIKLLEVKPGSGGGPVQYRLSATGVPRDVTFDVWGKDFRQQFREIALGFRVDGSGVLASSPFENDQPKRLDEMTFSPGPYPRGAAWEVALVSLDRKIKAFDRVIPRPIVAHDGPCTVFLELASARGERFVATGTGFAAGDDVAIESQFAGQVSRRRSRISAGGLLQPDDIALAPIGPDRRARYSVKGRSCEVTLEYDWGAPALQRR